MSSHAAITTCGLDRRAHRDPRGTPEWDLADRPERSRAAADARSDPEVEARDANQSLTFGDQLFFRTIHAIMAIRAPATRAAAAESHDRMDRHQGSGRLADERLTGRVSSELGHPRMPGVVPAGVQERKP
jgi:hypothetical protein